MPFEEWDDIVGPGYVIEPFAIRKVDVASALDTAASLAREFNCQPDEFDQSGWRAAYQRTHPDDELNLIFNAFRGDLMDWGVVAGVHRSELIRSISEAVEGMAADDLYTEPIDETRREVQLPPGIKARPSLPTLTTSDRDLANERVGIAIAVAFQECLWWLMAMAVGVAREAATIVGRDAAAAPERYGLRGKALPVKRTSAADRDRLTRSATKIVRQYLKDMLRGPEMVRRVGRHVEVDRDHRAYCMRERLVHSEEFKAMQRNPRYALAKERVIAEVIAPAQGGCSPANFQRIMDAGKAVHRRTVPNLPYCERWPLSLEPSRK